MTIVVGCSPDQSSRRGALHLAVQMARSADEELRLVAIVPNSWPPGFARIDAEYRTHVTGLADQALHEARTRLPADIRATVVREEARSIPAGILEQAAACDASYVVVGSSAAGVFGHIALGTTTDRLLHSSHVPVALAPRGYKAGPQSRITRITAAYDGTERDDQIVVAASAVASRVDATVRLASFAVYAPAPAALAIGRDAEEEVVDEWQDEISAYSARILHRVAQLPDAPAIAESVVGRGHTWSEALDDVDWADGDVLVVGSSSVGPVARVFLGSRAAKIVRHAPVPVILVPRSSTETVQTEGIPT